MTDTGPSSLGSFDATPNYELEIDPEFPPAGSWGCDAFAFDLDANVVPELLTRWGAPKIVRVKPSARPEWVGMYPADGLGWLTGVFETPSPDLFCVVAGGSAYLTAVDRPAVGTTVVQSQVQQVVADHDHQLLLLANHSDLVAVGKDGVAWRSRDLAMDGLRITRTTALAIECTGAFVDPEAPKLLVDPVTGRATRRSFGEDFPQATPI
jgi:hypothetical protein